MNMQNLINSGMAWRLEGHIGRQCMAAIEGGICMLGQKSHRDYYGGRIPSRDEVEAGTPGSYEFVEAHYGKDHADEMAAVGEDFEGLSD